MRPFDLAYCISSTSSFLVETCFSVASCNSFKAVATFSLRFDSSLVKLTVVVPSKTTPSVLAFNTVSEINFLDSSTDFTKLFKRVTCSETSFVADSRFSDLTVSLVTVIL